MQRPRGSCSVHSAAAVMDSHVMFKLPLSKQRSPLLWQRGFALHVVLLCRSLSVMHAGDEQEAV